MRISTHYDRAASVQLLQDWETGRSRGFGFVEMPSATEAQAAIEGLNGRALGGRLLTVNAARPRAERRPREDGERPRRPRGKGKDARPLGREVNGRS